MEHLRNTKGTSCKREGEILRRKSEAGVCHLWGKDSELRGYTLPEAFKTDYNRILLP